jgi:hypothetical protein
MYPRFRVEWLRGRGRPSVWHSVTISEDCGLRVLTTYLDIRRCGPSSQVKSSQVKSIHKQQTTIRKPIECAPVASRGGRE